MADFVIIVVITALVGGAVWYIRKEKKKGAHCMGCPSAGTCTHRMNDRCTETGQE